jgi:hypothetical protein
MRRICIVMSLLLVPAATAGTSAWTDRAGDAADGPDIVRVGASTSGGRVTFTVVTSSATDWEGAVAFVKIGDADTLTLHSNHDLVTHEHGDVPVGATQAAFSLTGSTLVLSVPLAEIGDPKQISFVVQTRGATGGDDAPDSGTWQLSTAASVRFAPAQPVHGRVFAVVGATTCRAKLAGKALSQGCRWRLPAKARGAQLTVVANGRTYRFRVR